MQLFLTISFICFHSSGALGGAGTDNMIQCIGVRCIDALNEQWQRANDWHISCIHTLEHVCAGPGMVGSVAESCPNECKEFIYGIKDGQLMSRCGSIGSCAGTDYASDVYECGGLKNYIKWSLDLGKEDFEIKSEFEAGEIAATALSFVLWSGKDMFHIGLDGKGKTLFYSGGSWGQATILDPTNLKPNTFQTIVIRRTGNVLKVALDGIEWDDLSLTGSIDAVGWSPWRNSIRVKNLVQIIPKEL